MAVVGLRGEQFASPGDPDESVIKGLEWLLERARAGELTGLAYSYTNADGATRLWIKINGP